MAELGRVRSAGGPASRLTRLAQRQVALERSIRDLSRRSAGPPRPVRPLASLDGSGAEGSGAERSGAEGSRELSQPPEPPGPVRPSGPVPPPGPMPLPSGPVPLRLLAEALGERALVEFVQLDDVLHAVTVAGGRIRLHQLGPLPPVRQLVDRIPFALRLLARPGTVAASRAAAQALLRDAARRIDDILLAPLAAALADRPLVLVPTDPLHSLPWSTQPSCAGRPVTVAPSAALWFAAHAGRRDGPAVVVAGPGLPGAQAEAAAVAAIHSARSLDGAAATVAATMAALDGAGLAHLAAHGRVHPDNPLFSALLLADGPLTAYDLERLPRLPGLVILAACDSGRLVVRAGDELLGLTATLLARGANQIVAAVVPVPDAETTPLMVELHHLLAAGQDPAAALAAAQQQVTRDASPAAAAAAGFVCLGG